MKNELKWGIVGSVFIIILTIIFTYQYQNQNGKLPSSQTSVNSGQISQTTTVTLTLDEVSKHNQPQDCWIVVDNVVYEVSNYLSEHPSGAGDIIPFCGNDATEAYNTKGGKGKDHSRKADLDLVPLKIGNVNEVVNLSK